METESNRRSTTHSTTKACFSTSRHFKTSRKSLMCRRRLRSTEAGQRSAERFQTLRLDTQTTTDGIRKRTLGMVRNGNLPIQPAHANILPLGLRPASLDMHLSPTLSLS